MSIQTLLFKAHNVKLLQIPPPNATSSGITREGLYDVSNWDWSGDAVVWEGDLKIVEEEFIDERPLEERTTARVEFWSECEHEPKLLGVSVLDGAQENVKQTHSRRAFRVLINHKEIKIGFGLLFDESSLANDFIGCVKRFYKKCEEEKELIESMETMWIDTTAAKTNDTTTTNDNDNDDDSDDDFGDFVTA